LPPGASPHTYDPKPSDIAAIEGATALFYVDDSLDGWVADFDVKHKVAVFEMLPEEMWLEMDDHGHGEHRIKEDGHKHSIDPHFWTKPMAVKAVLPQLVIELSKLDPGGKDKYGSNAQSFAVKLDELHEEVTRLMKPYSGESLLLFHPSFNYFADAYGLEIAGVIEPFPGKEPSPKYLINLVKTIKAHDVKAIFTEPQLPLAPARTIANETGLPLYILDPLGGVEGRRTYGELILYNVITIAEAFSG